MIIEHIDYFLDYLDSCEIAILYTVNKKLNEKLIKLKSLRKSIWKGSLPEKKRAKFWIYQSPMYIVQQQAAKFIQATPGAGLYEKILKQAYQEETQEESPRDVKTILNDIQKDIPRTYLVSGNPKEEAKLLNILLSFAYIKPSIGYCQGMNFIGAVLLKVLDNEEISFWMLLAIIKKWDMENMYVPGVPDLPLREFQMNHYINNLFPDLYTHFRKIGVTSGFFISRWFMTIFSTYLTFDVLVKVWDCFLIDGWKAAIKIAITLLKEIRPMVIQFDLDEISKFLRNNLYSITGEDILKKSSEVHVTKNVLKRLEDQFYMDQVNFKLMAVEISHVSSEQDITTIRWAKGQIDTFDQRTRQDIEKFQKKMQKLDHELETFTKHYLVITMDYLRLHNELENMTEKKNFYTKMLKEMKSKFKKTRIKRLMVNFLKKKNQKNSEKGKEGISKEDVEACQEKLFTIISELEILQQQYNEKAAFYHEALHRAQELNAKKASYSDQLCEFLKIIK